MKQFILPIVMAFCSLQAISQHSKDTCCGGESNEQPDCCCNDTIMSCLNDRYQQVALHTVIYDFKTKQIAFPRDYRSLKREDAVRVKVINFNPYIFKVVIDNRDSTYGPQIDNNNFLSAILNYSNLSGIVTSLGSTTNTPVGMQLAMHTINLNLTAPGASRTTELNDIFSHHKDSIVRFNDMMLRVKDDYDILVYKWSRMLKAQRELFPDCTKFLTLKDSAAKIETILRQFRVSFVNTRNRVSEAQLEYLNDATGYIDLITAKNAIVFNRTDSLIRLYYAMASKNLDKIDSAASFRSIQLLMESLDKVKDLRTCYVSPPLFLIGDSKILSLQIRPWKDSLPLITDPPVTFELPWQQHKIWGISGGIYASSLHNDNYTNQPIVGGSTYKLTNDRLGQMEFGVNALAYFASKIKDRDDKYDYLGFCFGAGMSIESKPKPRIMAGLSYVTGRNNRFVVSLFSITGQVSKLSSAYFVDGTYAQPQENYMKNALRTGVGLSLSYSFLGK